jgi:hypothetical protein
MSLITKLLAYKLFNRTNIVIVRMNMLGLLFDRKSMKLFREEFPEICEEHEIVLSYDHNCNILSFVYHNQNPSPDNGWIEIHAASAGSFGLRSKPFLSIIDTIAWLPTHTQSVGSLVDLPLNNLLLSSILYKLGFRITSVVERHPNQRAIFSLRAKEIEKQNKIKQPAVLKMWRVRKQRMRNHKKQSTKSCKLTKMQAAWWLSCSDALCWLGADEKFSAQSLMDSTETSHTFIYNSVNGLPAWSLCIRNGNNHSAYLLLNEPLIMNRHNVLLALAITIQKHIPDDCVVRASATDGKLDTVSVLIGLYKTGLSPNSKATMLMKH